MAPENRLHSGVFRVMRNLGEHRNRNENEPRKGEERHWKPRLDEEIQNGAKNGVSLLRPIKTRPTKDAVRRVFGKMKDEQREVLYLICVKRLPYEETAEILGVPINTVANRLALARLALHEGLSEIRVGANGNVSQTRNTGR